MKTIINKLFFGGLFIFLSWKGLDGLIINIIHSSTITIDILELEKHPQFDPRNLEITHGIGGDDFLYLSSESYGTVDIVYPLFSREQATHLSLKKPIVVKVLVRLTNQSEDCVSDGACIPKDGTTIKGLAKTGLENFPIGNLETLESELIKLDKNAIVVEQAAKPILWYWNLVMFLVGTSCGYVILKSFFRKASDMDDIGKNNRTRRVLEKSFSCFNKLASHTG